MPPYGQISNNAFFAFVLEFSFPTLSSSSVSWVMFGEVVKISVLV